MKVCGVCASPESEFKIKSPSEAIILTAPWKVSANYFSHLAVEMYRSFASKLSLYTRDLPKPNVITLMNNLAKVILNTSNSGFLL